MLSLVYYSGPSCNQIVFSQLELLSVFKIMDNSEEPLWDMKEGTWPLFCTEYRSFMEQNHQLNGIITLWLTDIILRLVDCFDYIITDYIIHSKILDSHLTIFQASIWHNNRIALIISFTGSSNVFCVPSVNRDRSHSREGGKVLKNSHVHCRKQLSDIPNNLNFEMMEESWFNISLACFLSFRESKVRVCNCKFFYFVQKI